MKWIKNLIRHYWNYRLRERLAVEAAKAIIPVAGTTRQASDAVTEFVTDTMRGLQ